MYTEVFVAFILAGFCFFTDKHMGIYEEIKLHHVRL